MRWALVVLLGACSYGILSTFAKLAYQEGFSAGEVIGGEILFGAMLSWLLVLMFRKRWKFTAFDRSKLAQMATGSLIGLTSILYFTSLRYIPASVAIVLLFQFAWIGVLVEAVLDRKRPSGEKWLAIFLLFAGTLLTGAGGSGDWRELPMPGLLLGLSSAVSYALYINLSGKVGTGEHPVPRSAWMLTGAAVLACVVFPPTFLWNGALPAGLWKWALMLAFFGCIVPTVCFAVGVPRIGGGLATILSSAELPTAVFMSALVLREPVSGWKWAGVAVILAGIAVPELSKWFSRTKRAGRLRVQD